MTPETTRLLELGAIALRAERITEADVDVAFHRDALRNLATRLASGEAVDAPARQLADAGQKLLAALTKKAQWVAATPSELATRAANDIRNNP